MHLSYPQTNEPNYFPELEIQKLAYKLKKGAWEASEALLTSRKYFGSYV